MSDQGSPPPQGGSGQPPVGLGASGTGGSTSGGGAPPPAVQPQGNAGGSGASTKPDDSGVQKVRAWTGLLVVVVGDIVIALAAIIAVTRVSGTGTNSSLVVSIVSSAFTAIGTMTTAYFGIRSMSNTAQSSINSSNAGST